MAGDPKAGGPLSDGGLFAVFKPKDVDGIAVDVGDVVLAAAGFPEAVEGVNLAMVCKGDCEGDDEGKGCDGAGYYCDYAFCVGVCGIHGCASRVVCVRGSDPLSEYSIAYCSYSPGLLLETFHE